MSEKSFLTGNSLNADENYFENNPVLSAVGDTLSV
jgi:hypothetical protein